MRVECREPVSVGRGEEGGDHVVAADPWPGDGGEQVSGVVVEPVDDLHAGAIS